jgi:type VI secretion system protein ImpM
MSDIRQPPGWYGKLPGTGDFVSRRLSAEVIRWWANWLQRSLQDQNERHPGWQQRYVRAPVWNFMIPGSWDGPGLQVGCIAPSCDRVGRCYPLCLLLPASNTLALDASALAAAFQDLARHGYSILEGIRHGATPEQLDQALSSPLSPPGVFGSHAWPELAQYLPGEEMTSYWWTHAAASGPMRRHVHHGALNSLLFHHLFDGPCNDGC